MLRREHQVPSAPRALHLCARDGTPRSRDRRRGAFSVLRTGHDGAAWHSRRSLPLERHGLRHDGDQDRFSAPARAATRQGDDGGGDASRDGQQAPAATRARRELDRRFNTTRSGHSPESARCQGSTPATGRTRGEGASLGSAPSPTSRAVAKTLRYTSIRARMVALFVSSSPSMALWLTTPTISRVPRAMTGPPLSPGQMDGLKDERLLCVVATTFPPARSARWIPFGESAQRPGSRSGRPDSPMPAGGASRRGVIVDMPTSFRSTSTRIARSPAPPPDPHGGATTARGRTVPHARRSVAAEFSIWMSAGLTFSPVNSPRAPRFTTQ